MEITLESSQSTHQSESNRQLFQWALNELEQKGYSSKVSTRMVQRMMTRLQGKKADFIQWVSLRPVYTESHYHKQNKSRMFVQQQLSRMVVRILLRKGYPKQSACHLAYRLIRHGGGPENCDVKEVIKATRSWPTLKT